jgi:hypothetical protein
MIKKVIKYFIVLILLIFLFIYNFGEMMYKSDLTIKKELTEEQIKKFESDIKDGKEININNYIVKENNYSNSVTEINSNISHFIEKTFRKLFKYFIKNIDY